MSSLLLLLGIVLSALTPTIAVLVTRYFDAKDRAKAEEIRKIQEEVKSERSDMVWQTTSDKLQEIHILVNARLTEALKRIDVLERALRFAESNYSIEQTAIQMAAAQQKIRELEAELEKERSRASRIASEDLTNE